MGKRFLFSVACMSLYAAINADYKIINENIDSSSLVDTNALSGYSDASTSNGKTIEIRPIKSQSGSKVSTERSEEITEEEVLATEQVTLINITDIPYNEIMTEDEDKFRAVREQVVVVEENTYPNKPEPEKIFVAVEQPAEFKGGQSALMKFISTNINYPESALQNGISGRVIVKFVIEKDGSITNATIVKGVDSDLDKEALRIIRRMPKWIPAKNNGQPVRSYYNLPVTFRTQQ